MQVFRMILVAARNNAGVKYEVAPIFLHIRRSQVARCWKQMVWQKKPQPEGCGFNDGIKRFY
jgi:hypothetical protein